MTANEPAHSDRTGLASTMAPAIVQWIARPRPRVAIVPLLVSGISLSVALAASATGLEETLVTANRFESKQNSDALSISTIDSDALSLTSAIHISESFFQVPGGWITRGNGQEHLTALRSPVFTGAGACGAFLMTEDLIPLRAAGFCNINQLFDANSEQAARIEVLRGPGSSVYGSNAMHGVINIITEPPAGARGGSFGVEGGPHGYGRGKLAADSVAGEHAVRLAANITHDGGYQEDTGFDQQKITLRHRVYQGSVQIDNYLGLSNLDQDTGGFIVGDDAFRDSDRKKENPNPDAFRDAKSMRAYSRWSFQDNGVDYQLTPYVRWNKMKFLQHFLVWQPTERNGHWSVGVQSIARFAALEKAIEISAGVDLEYTEGWLTERQAEDFLPHLPAGTHYDYDVDASLLAPFVFVKWSITDKTWIESGLRWEYASYDYDNKVSDGSACAPTVTNCRFFRPADRDDTFSDLSPRVALLHQLDQNQQLYVNISRGFRAPQTTELYRLQDGQAVADLDSERLDSIELGYRLRTDRIDLEASLYAMEKQDYIFQDTNRYNVSGGESEHQGLELLIHTALTEQLILKVSATWAQHRYSNDISIAGINIKDNQMDTAPVTLGRAALQWQFTPQGIGEIEVVHMGDYWLDPENSNRYKGHNLYNLNVQYQLSPAWRIRGRVTNLTDIDYAERADLGFGSERYFVGEPRSAYLGVELSW